MINHPESKAGPSKPSPLRPHPYPSPASTLSSSAPAHIGSFPSYISKEDEQSHDHDHDDEHEHGYSDAEGSEVDVIPTRVGRKLCVRHKQMANQNVNAKLQKSLDSFPLHERSAITSLWSTFSQAPHNKRKLILEGILTMCCFSQLSHLSDSLNQIIRIDPFSLLPREVNLRILGYLDAISLGRAAQVNKSWKALADDDLLWRRMCGQHIDRKCEKCGWGLPLLERRRLKVELKDRSPAVAFGINEHGEHSHKHSHEPTKLVTRVEALGGKKGPAAENITTDRMSARTVCDPAVSTAWLVSSNKRSAPSSPAESSRSLGKRPRIEVSSDSETETTEKTVSTDSNGLLSREVRLTRPWKTVYCERLVVERNWRKGRCLTKTLKGHKDGVMCLQYHTTLSNPSYPVLITGSYDRTVRVWNLDTGEEVRALHGHTRAVRALQFDQMLLFTGAMDGTVRMWNWRAGECLRVLEGHTDGVVSLNYNGYLLATGSADSTIQVWNFRNGSKFTLRGHEDWVNSVVLWDGKTSPGDIDPTQMPSFTKNHEDAKTSSTTSADDKDKDKKPDIDAGAMLFSASDDGTVKLWDLTTQQCVRTFAGHKAQIQSMKVLMVDMTDEEIDATSTRSERVRKALTPPTGFVSGANAQLSPSPPMPTAQLALPEGFDPRAHMNSMASRQGPVEPRVYVHPSPDKRNGKASARGGRNKGDGGKEVTGEDGRRKRAILATGSLDGTIKLWCVDSGEEQTTLFGHIEGVWAVDMDALRLASASHDRTIKVWDRESGNCVQTLVGHRGAVTSLQLSDDMIVSGSDDGDVMVWSFAPSAVLPGNPGCGEGTPTPAAIY